IKSFIINIRTIRAEMNLSPSQMLPVMMQDGSQFDIKNASEYKMVIKSLAKISDLTPLAANEPSPISATSLIGDMTLHIPLKGLIDKEKEIARLTKEIAK